MKICHVSDNHGSLPMLPDEQFDALVCTGDFLPTGPVSPARLEREYQSDWLTAMKDDIRKWIGDVPFLWCAGNHDFIDPCSFLRKLGVEAMSTTDRWINFYGLMWYGFPYINRLQGKWEYGLDRPDMQDKVDAFMSDSHSRGRLPDVLLAHAPLVGLFDEANDEFGNIEHCGNVPMTNALSYEDELRLPRWYLCGHVHTPGLGTLRSMRVSNAATTAHVIHI